jgi:two-component system nitrogen regulation sensor histidine kinase NtrY
VAEAQERARKKGPRIIAAIIVFLIVAFILVEVFYRESQGLQASPLTGILLTTLQVVVVLFLLIVVFVLGRYLIKLYMERRRKLPGSHFKTKLVMFFIGLSLIPSLLLFYFASDLISRNIESWFRTPLDKLLEDTKSIADGFYGQAEEITLYYAQQLGRDLVKERLFQPEKRPLLRDFIREKLKEYRLDEIGIFLGEEELFSYLNPDIPLQDYRDLKPDLVKRAYLGDPLRSVESLGNGEIVRRGVPLEVPEVGPVLVTTGKFLSQNYAEKINNIQAYVNRYRLGKIQKDPVKTFYLLTLVFITVLIVFAASWIGLHLARSITAPIEKLAQATRDVSKGNLDVHVEDPASDELGILIESFNQMIADLKSSQQDLAVQTEELEARRHYIETVLNNITTGVVALDAAGTIITINPSAREMLGLRDQAPLGLSYKEVLDPPRYEDLRKNIDWGLRNKQTLSDKEINILDNGQQTTLALAMTPLRVGNSDFSGLIVVLDDLTQLIKAQKIAAWKEVAQRVAHEIKNPLTPIQLSAERIIKNLQRKEPAAAGVIAEGAQTIIQEATTIKSLVDEFSDFARLPKVRLQPADLHAIIDQVLALFRGIFSEVEFEVRYASDVPSRLQVDPDQIKRVFINLIDNAIDAMNKKGQILIRTQHDPDQHRVLVEVIDSGPGIPREDKDRLFLPYFSTKKKGTGLGLAIVDQIVREHNGTISVQDNQPSGAKFIIQLPTP